MLFATATNKQYHGSESSGLYYKINTVVIYDIGAVIFRLQFLA